MPLLTMKKKSWDKSQTCVAGELPLTFSRLCRCQCCHRSLSYCKTSHFEHIQISDFFCELHAATTRHLQCSYSNLPNFNPSTTISISLLLESLPDCLVAICNNATFPEASAHSASKPQAVVLLVANNSWMADSHLWVRHHRQQMLVHDTEITKPFWKCHQNARSIAILIGQYAKISFLFFGAVTLSI